MTEYTVHFQKGRRIGTRSLRMIHVDAVNADNAMALAAKEFPDARAQGYRISRVDHFDGYRLVIDR